MRPKKGCKSCEIEDNIRSNHILESSELSIVNYCNDPKVVGHLIIQPRRHVENLIDLNVEEIADLARLAWKYNKVLLLALDPKPEKTYLCLFSESPDWHLHFHIIPRNAQIPLAERGDCIFRRKPPSNETSEENISKTIVKIKDAIKKLQEDP